MLRLILFCAFVLSGCGAVSEGDDARVLKGDPYRLYFVDQTIKGNRPPVEYMIAEARVLRGSDIAHPTCPEGIFLHDTVESDTGKISMSVLLLREDRSIDVLPLFPPDFSLGSRAVVQLRNPSRSDQPACARPDCSCLKFSQLLFPMEDYSFEDSLAALPGELPYPWTE